MKQLARVIVAWSFVFLWNQYGKAERIGFPIFHEATRFHLGGDGSWDALTADSTARRLYVARSNRVMVVDLDSGKLIKEIPDTDGAHGIAVVPKANLGFATGGHSGLVTVFDLKDFKVKGHVPVGQDPDAIIYDSSSHNVFVFNKKGHDVSVIDPKSQKVVGTIPLEADPEFAVSDNEGNVFVNLEDKNSVAEIDAKAMKLSKTYPLDPCQRPTGLSIDVKSHRLIVGCGNNLAAIVNSKTGKVLKTFAVGKGVDGTSFNPEQRLAFISAGEGKLTVLKESESRGFEQFQDVDTPVGSRTSTVDEKTGNVLLPSAQFGPDEAPQAGQKHPHHSILPGTFFITVIAQ